MKKTLLQLYRISRPHLWMYLLGPYMIGSVYLVLQEGDWVIPWILWFLLYILFPANLFVYGVNDLADADTDQLNEKKQGYEGQVDHRKQLIMAIGLTQLPWLLSLFFVPVESVTYITLFMLLGFFYSTPPIRAKAKPFIDSWFNILYVLPGFFIASFAGDFYFNETIFFAAWAWCIAMHAYSAIPDIDADAKAGLHTTATVLGKSGTLVYCGLFWLLSAGLSQIYFGNMLIPFLLFLPYLGMLYRTHLAASDSEILALYKQFPIINTAVGMILFFSVLL